MPREGIGDGEGDNQSRLACAKRKKEVWRIMEGRDRGVSCNGRIGGDESKDAAPEGLAPLVGILGRTRESNDVENITAEKQTPGPRRLNILYLKCPLFPLSSPALILPSVPRRRWWEYGPIGRARDGGAAEGPGAVRHCQVD